jgi:nitroimidazol reductase NimA-like FMN-containing flavoprotein (pyridoxamine 5'-phosphate oxidase superfamily)
MPSGFALEVADKCAYAVMATVNPDGTPYCIPLSMAREGEWIYFHCAKEGHKIDNLSFCNRVCVSCVGDVKAKSGEFTLEYESAVIFGTACEVTGSEEKLFALRLISERYTPEVMASFDEVAEKALNHTGIWKIHIDGISGKRNA